MIGGTRFAGSNAKIQVDRIPSRCRGVAPNVCTGTACANGGEDGAGADMQFLQAVGWVRPIVGSGGHRRRRAFGSISSVVIIDDNVAVVKGEMCIPTPSVRAGTDHDCA